MEEEKNIFDLGLPPLALAALSESARWARFLSVIGFIFCALMALGGVAGVLVAMVAGTGSSSMGVRTAQAGALAVYLVLAVIYFFPCRFLFLFAGKTQDAIAGSDQEVMTQAFSNLKSMFKYMGIVTIVGIALSVLALVSYFLVLGMG